MEKLTMHSPDLTASNIDTIAEIFPGVITETIGPDGETARAVDFDLLRQELSDHVVEGPQERYQLDWPGKREALFAANAPIAKTLRPARDTSVNFDTTKNLFIEGDNLDALKLLRESYLGKVKVIYIDPPYNTGGDRFVYPDDYAQDNASYLEYSGQVTNTGARLVSNVESNGRFHSDWLTMMYARLRAAKPLLRDDGVIFVSINDAEQANLRSIMDEVFGASNFIATVVWKNATDNNPTRVAGEHEYLLVYARRLGSSAPIWQSTDSAARDLLVEVGDKLTAEFTDPVKLQDAYRNWHRENRRFLGPLDDYRFIDTEGVYAGSRSVHNPGKEGYRYDVIHPATGQPCKQPLLGYRFPESTMTDLLNSGRVIFGEDETKIVELKVYAKDFKQKFSSVIELDGRRGANELRQLFGSSGQLFTNPKPVSLLREVISFVLGDDEVVLDFFAGSGTSAQAVFELNAEDGGTRNFIAVQLPEPTPEGSPTRAAGYPTIADFCRDRIRLAGEAASGASADADVGFRAFRIDTTSLTEVAQTPDSLDQAQLEVHTASVKPDRSADDLLFQVLISWGLELTLPITLRRIAEEEVFVVGDGAVAACFADTVPADVVRGIASFSPLRAVFRDSSFESDDERINAREIFKEISPITELKTI